MHFFPMLVQDVPKTVLHFIGSTNNFVHFLVKLLMIFSVAFHATPCTRLLLTVQPIRSMSLRKTLHHLLDRCTQFTNLLLLSL